MVFRPWKPREVSDSGAGLVEALFAGAEVVGLAFEFDVLGMAGLLAGEAGEVGTDEFELGQV
ncbi:MAG: hypothetical protein QG608_251, partial [Actinomycetota bacterium]|nr:hypothetical protein [Actinomycetota bacterium]